MAGKCYSINKICRNIIKKNINIINKVLNDYYTTLLLLLYSNFICGHFPVKHDIGNIFQVRVHSLGHYAKLEGFYHFRVRIYVSAHYSKMNSFL